MGFDHRAACYVIHHGIKAYINYTKGQSPNLGGGELLGRGLRSLSVFLAKDASSVFIISTDTMNSQLHQCQELLRDYNLDVLPALYAALDEDIFIARPSFCCHHCLVFIISFWSHPTFFLLFFFFLLRSIQIARVAMGKWQNIDLMVPATCVAGSVSSSRLFFLVLVWFFFLIPTQRSYRSLLQRFP